MLNNSNILITGGTGSFGNQFISMVLKNYNPKKIVILSRDEMKQWKMKGFFKNDKLRFFIGDVRDKSRLYRVMSDIDIVIHAAATKIVPTAELDPFECVKTNIIGAMNVIDAAIDQKVKKVVALSTDKASNPINLYGATKLASDKLFIASRSYTSQTRFAIVRYGNVMGSRGSVIPFFINQANTTNELTITDKRMTRFMISLRDAVNLVIHSIGDMLGGEVYVKKIPSMKILDIAKAIAPKAKIKFIGIRPGEKLHEQMIGQEDSPYTYEYKDYFKIIPQIFEGTAIEKKMKKNGKKVSSQFSYSSDTNKEWMTKDFFTKWISHNKEKFLKI